MTTALRTHCDLPGGAWIDGRLARTAVVHPITGRLEQELFEQFTQRRSWPEVVSCVLATAVESIGGSPCSLELAENLTVPDRQYLLLCLGRLLHGDDFWTSVRCGHCDAWFDLRLSRSRLPIKHAGAGFPFVELDCAGHRVRLRVPTGADQYHLLGQSDAAAVRLLLRRCIVLVDESVPNLDFAELVCDGDLARIEVLLDEAAPDVGTRVQTRCPECDTEQVVEVDPYAAARWQTDDLYREVHVIAARYHWAESEILSLPRDRRHRYLRLIDEEHGIHH
jgi:hypothetical protein